jgi:serine/threonine protein kinase
LKNNLIKLGDLGEAKTIGVEDTITVRGSDAYKSPEMHKRFSDSLIIVTFKTDVW